MSTTIVAFAQSGATSTKSCADHLNTSKEPKAEALLNCLVEMQRSIDRLVDASNKTGKDGIDGKDGLNGVDGINGRNGVDGKDGAPGEIPSGAVVAFDRPNGCPSGWNEFSAGAGKFLIGVDGNKYKVPYVAGNPEYVIGGEERVKLNIAEMPRHNHPIRRTTQSSGDGNFVNWSVMGGTSMPGTGIGTANVGGSQSHNNMPPYIALYFCKKN